jgi:hypothetical protein
MTNTYSVLEGEYVCNKCPDHAECIGSTIEPLKGYWKPEYIEQTSVYECLNSRACLYHLID